MNCEAFYYDCSWAKGYNSHTVYFANKKPSEITPLIMKEILKIPAALTLMAASTFVAQAGSIGVNVGPNSGTLGENSAPEAPENNELLPGTSAGVLPQTNWNNLMGGSLGATALTDDSGTLLATTATVSTQWSNGVQDHGTTDGDQILMNGGVDNGGGPQSSTVVGIPYPLYDVYIYYDGGSAQGRGGAYYVLDTDNGDAVLATQDAYDTDSFSGTYILGNGLGVDGSGLDENGEAIGSNYVLFTGLSAANIRIESDANLLGNPATPRAPWNGFQIVEVGGGGGGDLEITAISYDVTADSATLTWRANPNATYSVFASTDLEDDWSSQVATGVDAVADEDLTDEGFFTTTIDLPAQGFTDVTKLFFRVEEAD
ncbi:MAG: hypothetical protein ACJAVK_003164 [Akkermansiaceae bacterium]